MEAGGAGGAGARDGSVDGIRTGVLTGGLTGALPGPVSARFCGGSFNSFCGARACGSAGTGERDGMAGGAGTAAGTGAATAAGAAAGMEVTTAGGLTGLIGAAGLAVGLGDSGASARASDSDNCGSGASAPLPPPLPPPGTSLRAAPAAGLTDAPFLSSPPSPDAPLPCLAMGRIMAGAVTHWQRSSALARLCCGPSRTRAIKPATYNAFARGRPGGASIILQETSRPTERPPSLTFPGVSSWAGSGFAAGSRRHW